MSHWIGGRRYGLPPRRNAAAARLQIGAGEWKVVDGTRAYANLVGGGQSASMWPSDSNVRWRAEGLLASG